MNGIVPLLASLALISPGLGRVRVLAVLVAAPSVVKAPISRPAAELLNQFKTARYFFEQLDVARKLVDLGDGRVLPELEPYLNDEDRHLRANAALVFAGLGDHRGFEIMKGIIDDQSPRPRENGVAGGNWTLKSQIRADRYYATLLLGETRDPRAVPVLIAILHEPELVDSVPTALGRTRDHRALAPLLDQLNEPDPDRRTLALCALESLGDQGALPRMRYLLGDRAHIRFDGLGLVSDAAKEAIAGLEGEHSPAESKCGREHQPPHP